MVDSANLNRLQLIRFCGMIQKTKNEPTKRMNVEQYAVGLN